MTLAAVVQFMGGDWPIRGDIRFCPVAVIHLLRHSLTAGQIDSADGRTCMTEGSYFGRTPEENYAPFLNALAGIKDDAGIGGYSQAGIRILREGLAGFRSEYRSRHGA